MDENFDAGLVFVIAPPFRVVDPHEGFEIGQQIRFGEEIADSFADHWRPPEATADTDLVAGVATLRVAENANADVMRLDRGAVMLGAGDRNLEFARQKAEFRMQARPLPHEFSRRAGIFDFVRRNTGKMVGSDIANAISGRLDCVHVDICQGLQHIGNISEFRPVELDVLARREVPVTLVPAIADHGQLAHLNRRQGAIGDGNAQHIGMQLEIKAVHQPQGFEFILGERAIKPAGNLGTKFRDTFLNKAAVEFVIMIHCVLRVPLVCRGRYGYWARVSAFFRDNEWAREFHRHQPPPQRDRDRRFHCWPAPLQPPQAASRRLLPLLQCGHPHDDEPSPRHLQK